MPELEAKAVVSETVGTMAKAYGGKLILNEGQFSRLLKLCELADVMNEEDGIENFAANAELGQISFEIPVLTIKDSRSSQFLTCMKNADYTSVRETGGVLRLVMGVERLWSKIE